MRYSQPGYPATAPFEGTVWVDFDAAEVYAFAANIPDFGPKTVPMSLELDISTGEVLRWIGVTDSHSTEGIEALAKYAFERLPSPRAPKLGWWDRLIRFINLR